MGFRVTAIGLNARIPQAVPGLLEGTSESGSVDDPLLEIAMDLERIALEDEYFAKRRLYPNVDFYSGIIFKALGIPTPSFTVMFAMGRLPGWIAQWMELLGDGQAIGRPRQIYSGASKRDFVPIQARRG